MSEVDQIEEMSVTSVAVNVPTELHAAVPGTKADEITKILLDVIDMTMAFVSQPSYKKSETTARHSWHANEQNQQEHHRHVEE